MNKTVFLPSLTTVTMAGTVGDWKAQIEEIKKLGLKEIALFPTAIEKEERYKLYAALREINLDRIPFVHLRTDMELEEVDYLVEHFHAEVFNLHTSINWPQQYDYSKYAKKIFIENGPYVPTEEELKKFGGLCLDFSHWENAVRLGDVEYDRLIKERVAKYPIGICHISPIEDELIPNPFKPEELQYDTHQLRDMRQLEYMKKYAQYVPVIAAIELENPIEKQLEVKKYLQDALE